MFEKHFCNIIFMKICPLFEQKFIIIEPFWWLLLSYGILEFINIYLTGNNVKDDLKLVENGRMEGRICSHAEYLYNRGDILKGSLHY